MNEKGQIRDEQRFSIIVNFYFILFFRNSNVLLKEGHTKNSKMYFNSVKLFFQLLGNLLLTKDMCRIDLEIHVENCKFIARV